MQTQPAAAMVLSVIMSYKPHREVLRPTSILVGRCNRTSCSSLVPQLP